MLVPIGEASEEIETTCITDTLTHCGADVTIVLVMPDELLCKMSHGIKVSRLLHLVNCYLKLTNSSSLTSSALLFQAMVDVSIEDAAKEEWDLVALPRGMPGKYGLKLICI
jgi:4-methyl-5(b-hydroxyethyl)-thiazole monophosphate biosynthesis